MERPHCLKCNHAVNMFVSTPEANGDFTYKMYCHGEWEIVCVTVKLAVMLPIGSLPPSYAFAQRGSSMLSGCLDRKA